MGEAKAEEKVAELEAEVKTLSKEKAEVEEKAEKVEKETGKKIDMPEMTPEVAEKAYEKYKKGDLPEMSAEVKAAAEKAYAKLHGAGVVEAARVEKRVLKKAKATDMEERSRIETSMSSLGDDAPHAAKAFQKFKQGSKVALSDEDQDAATAAWKKYKNGATDVDSATSAARAASQQKRHTQE